MTFVGETLRIVLSIWWFTSSDTQTGHSQVKISVEFPDAPKEDLARFEMIETIRDDDEGFVINERLSCSTHATYTPRVSFGQLKTIPSDGVEKEFPSHLAAPYQTEGTQSQSNLINSRLVNHRTHRLHTCLRPVTLCLIPVMCGTPPLIMAIITNIGTGNKTIYGE